MPEKVITILPILTSLVLSGCGASSEEIKEIVDQSIKNLVFVEGGSFMMGDGPRTLTMPDGTKQFRKAWTGYRNNKPMHKVTLDSYYISKYEVTWKEFDVFSKDTGRELKLSNKLGSKNRLPTSAVRNLHWQQAKDYCEWVGKVSGRAFDLPTEAQWEFAARSRGKDVLYATDTGWLDKGVNYGKQVEGIPVTRAKPVGMHPPNPLGIYDMSFNASEWVNDWYDSKYYQQSPENNPQGPSKSHYKVWRGPGGGSPEYGTVYARGKHKLEMNDAGMRCVVNESIKR